jgi:ABC-type nitrate/sulfonate/bicarbonate transport system ATPase subunit
LNQPIPLLQLTNVSKSFVGDAGHKISVLEGVDFSIDISEKGSSIISILSPFGSGKSTLLKIISGIERPSDGEVLLNEKNVHQSELKIPYISEKPSSFPWLNVEQNIEFGIRLNKNGLKEMKTNDLINLVGLRGYENYFPHNKSNGFRFRIALARALVQNPPLILIDDSFKAMDPETREEIHSLLISASVELRKTFIIATTNVVEAISLSNRILLMSGKPGRIIKELTSEPENAFKEDIYKSEKFTHIKNQIENTFREEKIINTINFSV